jgi:hypothetical protein
MDYIAVNQMKLIFHSYTKHRAYDIAFDSSFDFVQFSSTLNSVVAASRSPSQTQASNPRKESFRKRAATIMSEGGKLLCDRYSTKSARWFPPNGVLLTAIARETGTHTAHALTFTTHSRSTTRSAHRTNKQTNKHCTHRTHCSLVDH